MKKDGAWIEDLESDACSCKRKCTATIAIMRAQKMPKNVDGLKTQSVKCKMPGGQLEDK